MDRIEVTSSTIISFGYDPASMLLEVEFKGGDVYQYTGVPQQHYDGMMAADSHGKYLNKWIKGHYPYCRA